MVGFGELSRAIPQGNWLHLQLRESTNSTWSAFDFWKPHLMRQRSPKSKRCASSVRQGVGNIIEEMRIQTYVVRRRNLPDEVLSNKRNFLLKQSAPFAQSTLSNTYLYDILSYFWDIGEEEECEESGDTSEPYEGRSTVVQLSAISTVICPWSALFAYKFEGRKYQEG